MKQLLISLFMAMFANRPEISLVSPVVQNIIPAQPVIMASKELDMTYRYRVPSVSEVFKDNILLNIAYLDGRVSKAQDIKWDKVTEPFHSEFTLNPNQSFAFHDAILPRYQDKVVITTKARFNKQDGFKTDGYLYGDGVCQLASLLNWLALDAKLQVEEFTNHDFAAIPEVPKEYGVSIYYDPGNKSSSAIKNLYITNNQDKPVTFHFNYDGKQLKVSVSKAS